MVPRPRATNSESGGTPAPASGRPPSACGLRRAGSSRLVAAGRAPGARSGTSPVATGSLRVCAFLAQRVAPMRRENRTICAGRQIGFVEPRISSRSRWRSCHEIRRIDQSQRRRRPRNACRADRLSACNWNRRLHVRLLRQRERRGCPVLCGLRIERGHLGRRDRIEQPLNERAPRLDKRGTNQAGFVVGDQSPRPLRKPGVSTEGAAGTVPAPACCKDAAKDDGGAGGFTPRVGDNDIGFTTTAAVSNKSGSLRLCAKAANALANCSKPSAKICRSSRSFAFLAMAVS